MPSLTDFLFGPGIGIAGSVVDAILRHRAVNKTADILQQGSQQSTQAIVNAANQGVDINKALFDYQSQLMKPYYEYGTGAMQTLGNLMGVKPATMPPMTWPANPNAPGAPGPPAPGGAPNVRANAPGSAPGVPTGGVAVPRTPPTLPPPGGAPPAGGAEPPPPEQAAALTRALPPPSAPSAPPPQAASTTPSAGAVTVQWPDGSTTKVPSNQLSRYTALGARVAGEGTSPSQYGSVFQPSQRRQG